MSKLNQGADGVQGADGMQLEFMVQMVCSLGSWCRWCAVSVQVADDVYAADGLFKIFFYWIEMALFKNVYDLSEKQLNKAQDI